MTWKVVNISDAGTSIKFGADDLDKLNKLLNGIDVDDVDINADFKIRSGKFQQRNPANTFSYIHTPAAIAGDRIVNWPLLTATDTVMFNDFAAVVKNKTFDSSNDITAAVVGSSPYTYLLYNDAGTYKARNGTTGVISYSGTDAGAVLKSIFDSVSTTTPLYIQVAAGDFTVKSWDVASFRHHNFTIKGAGSGLTNFIIHNDIANIAGQDRAFAFEAAGSGFTSIALGSNAAKDDFAVLTNSTTDLVAGCHVVIGSTAIVAGSARKGEHNRVVAIVATGGSPSQRIILEKATRFAYATADSAFIRKVDYLENNHIEGITIRTNQDLTSNISLLRFDFPYDLHVKDVNLKDWSFWGTNTTFHSCLVVNCAVNSYFNDMTFEQSPEHGNTDDPGSVSDSQNITGYAVSARGGCETVYFENLRFKGMIRHCFTTTAISDNAKNGHPTNIWLINCNAETTTEASFDTHAEGDGINFINCSTVSNRRSGNTNTTEGTDDTDAFNCRSNNTRFINCYVENNGGNGFSSDNGLTGIVFDGCYVNTTTGSSDSGITCGSSDSAVRNCWVNASSQDGIQVSGNRVVVSNNIVENCTSDGIEVTTATNLVITGNILKSNGAYGINFSAGDCTSNIITDNQFISNTSGAVLNGDQTGNIEINNVGYGSSAAKIVSTSGAINDINTTSSETDMLNYSVPANALGANGCVRFTLSGYILQNQATGTVYTFKVKFGGTVLYEGVSASLAQSAVKLPYRIEGEIGNSNSTAAQSFSGHIEMNDNTTGNATGLGVITDDEQGINATFSSEGADTTKDTTAAQTLQVTVTMSVSNSATHTVIKRKIVELMKSA